MCDVVVFFFKQKTAYEMRISDWSSDVCSSDLVSTGQGYGAFFAAINAELADAGATIVNNSWGGLYWDDPAVTVEFADAYRDFVITRGGLVVFANGNAGDDPALRANPSDTAALPHKAGLAGDQTGRAAGRERVGPHV